MEHLIKMVLGYSDEEFNAILDELIPDIKQLSFDFGRSCYPDTCSGQCQGMGWCYTCEEFMDGGLMEDHFEELMG